MFAIGVALGLGFFVSFFVIRFVCRYAHVLGVVDVPNFRSSHYVPTPRAGGVGIYFGFALGLTVLFLSDLVSPALFIAFLAGSFGVAAVGYLDDKYSLSPLVRISVHLLAALLAVSLSNSWGALQFGAAVYDLGFFGYLTFVVGVVWSINAFNFMDGIDGLVGCQVLFVSVAWVMLQLFSPDAGGSIFVAGVVAFSVLAFLVFNWPPASIFMGDVGSGLLGYIVALMALSAAQADPAALWLWVVLCGFFIADATVTLIRRLVRGEPVYQAHRTHAYQHLSRRWGHRVVTLLFLAGNLVVTLPVAFLVSRWPFFASWVAVSFIVVLCFGFAALGSGRRE